MPQIEEQYTADRLAGDMAWVMSRLPEGKCKYKIETYGCQMNAHDSEKLAFMLDSMGYIEAGNGEEPDLIIFNTCCVREHAELKVHGNVGALRKRKEEDPNLVIAVCGCMMQQKSVARDLVKKYPFIDIVFGTHNLHTFPALLRRCLEGKPVREVWEHNDALAGSNLPAHRKDGVTAYVNIMYGCDNYCTYCIVPYVRGHERSRPHAEILEEVSRVAAQGYGEIMLLGQNVNSYGHGVADEWDFAGLLEQISRIEAVKRIRFMTSHPKDLSDRLIEVMASNQKVCSQLHLPVQSGSSDVLRSMNRRYTREDYLRLVDKLRGRVGEHIGLTTDIIVGFPGETQEQFLETLSLVQKVRYHAAYMFMYSPRQGTIAAQMPDQIPETVKKERLHQLIELQNSITGQIHQGLIGKVEPVLVESRSKRDAHAVSGRTDSGRMVTFPGGDELIGKMVPVKITQANPNTLGGERIDDAF